jgi:hypothetical protein
VWEVSNRLTRQFGNLYALRDTTVHNIVHPPSQSNASSDDDIITIKAETPAGTWTSSQRTVDHQREIRK